MTQLITYPLYPFKPLSNISVTGPDIAPEVGLVLRIVLIDIDITLTADLVLNRTPAQSHEKVTKVTNTDTTQRVAEIKSQMIIKCLRITRMRHRIKVSIQRTGI